MNANVETHVGAHGPRPDVADLAERLAALDPETLARLLAAVAGDER